MVTKVRESVVARVLGGDDQNVHGVGGARPSDVRGRALDMQINILLPELEQEDTCLSEGGRVDRELGHGTASGEERKSGSGNERGEHRESAREVRDGSRARYWGRETVKEMGARTRECF